MNSAKARLHHPGSSLLEETLAAATKDTQTVSPKGESLDGLIEGMHFREVPTHIDERGSVVEMFDPRWGWHSDPIVFAYSFTIKPGYAKGWNLHKLHEDRYFLLQGEMALILYDVRPESSTCGQVRKIILSGHRRGIVNVPKNVWHADHNIGIADCLVVNFPTTAYEHTNPDKYRLPLDTALIPYRFRDARGW